MSGLRTMSKVERYNWARPGVPGELMWVPKSELDVDHCYQRCLNEAKVHEIAIKFSWPAFGVVVVARRPDGTMFIVDAQHRHAAAMKRDDIHSVPCVVFDIDETRDEAAHFLSVNTNRRTLTSIDRHKAFVTIGDHCSTVVEELVSSVGRAVSDSRADGVRCVRTIRKWIERDEKRVRDLWPLIDELSGRGPILERTVDGLLYLDEHLDGTRLCDPRWKRRVLSIGVRKLLEGAARAAAYFAKGGAKQWAHGMLQEINLGLQEKNRLKMIGGDE